MTSSWIDLVSAALRLVDLHDSYHEPRSKHTSVSRECRSGLNDGYWLDIACLLLEYLQEQDYETNGQYIPQARCLHHLRHLVPQLTGNDLAYVVNLLSTPSELHYRKRERAEEVRKASTKSTTLLEKQSQIGHVRLSRTGRQSVILARQMDDILYSEHDAIKIVSAIARSDFDKIPSICDSILLSIRGLTQEIRRIRENPALEGKLESFRANRKHYETAIRNIQSTIMGCRKQFVAADVRERFDRWSEQQEMEWDLPMINLSFSRVLSAMENLNRRLTDLLRDIAEGRIQSMGVIDFNRAAFNLASQPPHMAALLSIFRQTAPFALAVTFPGSEDYREILDNRRAEQSPGYLVYDILDDETANPLQLQRFLRHFGAQMRDTVQHKPLPLSEALAHGWYRATDDSQKDGSHQDFLPQLINMFVDTEQLLPNLCVAVHNTALDVHLPDGRHLYGDNPVLLICTSDPTVNT